MQAEILDGMKAFVDEAKTSVDESQAEYDAAVKAAEAEYNSASAFYNEASALLEQANAAEAEKENALNIVQADVNAAEEKVASTKQAVDEAQEKVTAIENSEEYAQAKADLDAREAELSAATQELETAKVAEAAAQQESANAEAYRVQCEDAAISAKITADEKAALLQAAETEQSNCRTNLGQAVENDTAAQNAVTVAQEALNEANKILMDKEAAVEAATEELEEAEKAEAEAKKAFDEANSVYEEAQAKYVLGIYAYFQDTGPVGARVLGDDGYDSKWYREYSDDEGGINFLTDFTDIGEDYDASSWENVFKALDFIDECNELRKSQGLSELKTSDYEMAVAIVKANIASERRGHQLIMETGGAGENLAWVYADPFDGWYDKEKALYDLGVTDFNITGHYQNIVTGGYIVTGFGVNTKNGSAYAQLFDMKSPDNNCKLTQHWKQPRKSVTVQ